ncbi:electron transfer flavoprotein subunit beta/FixA family protein [Azohydromonas australica]|uniref:electron transfer flavoprotein subunit beta/FixA family protein n=1 Tax=Azohydromonas australica TaxID=364039 RepID=UPI000407CD99|nr:electron transfer flavoprotein subunit beta/FixA family protein [Azohydromonas australica]
MHILVPVKRVVDYNVKVRVKADGTGVDTTGVKMSMNPFDEVAVEQAVRLREKGIATKVTVVTCGAPIAQDVLRTGLAMGADAAILVDTGASPAAMDSLGVARVLQALVQREQIGLVLCGKQAIDDDLGAVGPMLAAFLDWPQAISVGRLAAEGGQLMVSCDGDQGLEQMSLPLPAVLSVDLRLCDPRTISLPNMMKAKKAVITTLPLAELGPVPAARSSVVAVTEPPARQAGVRVPDVDTLIERLKSLPALQPAN